MNIAFWIINAVLALVFLAAGGMKLSKDKAALKASKMEWVDDFSAGAVKAIGAAELLGAIGLIVPKLADIAPVLAPVAAICLAVTMAGAAVVHVRRSEPPVPPLVLAVLSVASAIVGFSVVS